MPREEMGTEKQKTERRLENIQLLQFAKAEAGITTRVGSGPVSLAWAHLGSTPRCASILLRGSPVQPQILIR